MITKQLPSCSGPIPAQKIFGDSVPGALFSHIMPKCIFVIPIVLVGEKTPSSSLFIGPIQIFIGVYLTPQVKQQHIDRNSDFLSEELKVMDKKAAKDRLFFVSAREALASRLSNDKVFATPGDRMAYRLYLSFLEYAHFCKALQKSFCLC